MASNALLAGGEKVLLQTAQVVMCNKDGLKCQVHVLMDIASHRIFMTEQMAKQLNLLPQRSESLSISTFWMRLKVYVIEFNIVGLPIPSHANVLQQITGPIRRGPLHQADVEFLQAITPESLVIVFPFNLIWHLYWYFAGIRLLLEYYQKREDCSSFWIVIVVIKTRVHTNRKILGSD